MGPNDNRVTRCTIEDAIQSEFYFTAAEAVGNSAAPKALELLTFCVLVLDNGFTVTGESACADPANYDAEIGMRIAKEKAVEKVWPLLGFRLRDRLHAEEVDAQTEEQLNLCLRDGGAV